MATVKSNGWRPHFMDLFPTIAPTQFEEWHHMVSPAAQVARDIAEEMHAKHPDHMGYWWVRSFLYDPPMPLLRATLKDRADEIWADIAEAKGNLLATRHPYLSLIIPLMDQGNLVRVPDAETWWIQKRAVTHHEYSTFKVFRRMSGDVNSEAKMSAVEAFLYCNTVSFLFGIPMHYRVDPQGNIHGRYDVDVRKIRHARGVPDRVRLLNELEVFKWSSQFIPTPRQTYSGHRSDDDPFFSGTYDELIGEHLTPSPANGPVNVADARMVNLCRGAMTWPHREDAYCRVVLGGENIGSMQQ